MLTKKITNLLNSVKVNLQSSINLKQLRIFTFATSASAKTNASTSSSPLLLPSISTSSTTISARISYLINLNPFMKVPNSLLQDLDRYCYYSTSSSSAASSLEIKCWKCGTLTKIIPKDFPPTCTKCSSLQDIDIKTIDYFQLLLTNTDDNNKKKNNSYQIDLPSISNRAKELQKILHPDRYTNKDQREQEISAKLSSFVNHAFATLHNPIERGLYLFNQQNGQEFDMESQLTLDTTFLGEVMELNEKLLELSNKKEWEDFKNENDEKLMTLERNLSKAFEKNDPTEIKLILSKMRYFDNLQKKLKEQQFKLGIVE